MTHVCPLCGTVMSAADIVCAGNAQHPDATAVCRDCTYNPAPTAPPTAAADAR